MSKDIYVIVEQRDTVIQKVGLELLGEATRLAEGSDHKVIAVLIGYDITSKAEKLFTMVPTKFSASIIPC